MTTKESKKVATPRSQQQMQRNEPIIETSISKSKDGRYIMHKTVITDTIKSAILCASELCSLCIKSVKYYEKVFSGA